MVLVHSSWAKSKVEAMGARHVRLTVEGIDPGPSVDMPSREQLREEMGLGQVRVLVHFGLLRTYKGTDDLLAQLASVEGPVVALIGGACPDAKWRAHLQDLARGCGERARLLLRRLEDAELQRWLTVADIGVFPFREVTNSGSVLRALGAGVPVIIPDLPELDDLPSDAVLRYRHPSGLGGALRAAHELTDASLRAMSIAALDFASTKSWAAAASTTRDVYSLALEGGQRLTGS
jgi:glycosyltransferase involved in cell wall biosynthesis